MSLSSMAKLFLLILPTLLLSGCMAGREYQYVAFMGAAGCFVVSAIGGLFAMFTDRETPAMMLSFTHICSQRDGISIPVRG